uniref:Toluene transport facilitator TodX-like protein n=1 Tax=Ectopseudomonas mendocina TaxID=300 RepID=Q8KT43_ECTME|nr:toluene transport facilitator TodX-like protein [Pseudomonas mendocina]
MIKMKIASVLVLPLSGYAFSVHATQVFDLEGYGAISRAMGGTSSSYYTGNAALISNPATLSLAPDGSQFELGPDIVSTDIEVRDSSGAKVKSSTESNNRGPYIGPQLSYVTQLDDWRFGAGLFVSSGLGTEYGSNSFLSQTENGTQTSFDNSSRLIVLRAPVGFSYQVTPQLTVGASADLVWTSLNLELLLPSSQVGALAAQGNLSGDLVAPLAGFVGAGGAAHFSLSRNNPVGGAVDAIGWGGRLGLTYKLTDKTVLGAMYNFKTSVGDLEGTATLSAISGDGAVLPLHGDIRVKDFEMPASLTFGFAHQFNERWLVAADVKRVYWSDVMEDISVDFKSQSGGIDIELPHNYQDITVASIGTAYRVNDKLTLRAGYSYAQQALDSRLILPVIPAYLKKHVSLGSDYSFDKKSKLNLAISFGLKESLNTPSYLSGTETLKQSHSQINAVVSYSKSF